MNASSVGITRTNHPKTLKSSGSESHVPSAMRLPPRVDEPNEPDELPYPIETLRHWYVSPFGGRSKELAADEVGVNRTALEKNTELAAKDRISVGLSGSDPDRPWFFQRPFAVVPLDEARPIAAELSRFGEVVLPDGGEWDFVRRPELQPRLGEAVVLKAAAKALEEHPEWLDEILAKPVRRPNF